MCPCVRVFVVRTSGNGNTCDAVVVVTLAGPADADVTVERRGSVDAAMYPRRPPAGSCSKRMVRDSSPSVLQVVYLR
jgi:hypothetical protein